MTKACETLLATIAERGGAVPREGLEVTVDTTEEITAQMTGTPLVRESFGAHFAQVRVDVDSGEVRMDRMVSVFAGGRVINIRAPAPNCSAA